MTDVNVRTKLTLDDAASGALNRIREGFSGVADASHGAEGGLGFLKSTLSQIVAFNFAPMIGQVKEWIGSFVDAASSDQQVTRTLTALGIAMEGLPIDEATKKGQELNDALDDMAISSGESGDALAYAYQRLVEIGGGGAGSLDKARVQLDSLVKVADVMGKDVGTIAGEFGFMQEGILRTKAPLFNLLKSTGIFGDNVKKAAGEWAKLTEEDRAKLLAKGLDQLGKSVAATPPSFAKLVTSFEEIGGVMKEVIGGPIVKALMPILENLKNTFTSHRAEIEKWATALGTDVGKWVTEAGAKMQEGFNWIKDHQAEIRSAIIDGVERAEALVKFILAHKEEIAIAFGAKSVAGSSLVKTGVSVASAVAKSGAAGTGALGLAGAAGGAAALAAFGAAIAGVAAAAWQGKKLLDETQGGMSAAEQDIDAIQRKFLEGVKSGGGYGEWSDAQQQAFTHMRENLVSLSESIGKSGREAGALADQAFEAHKAMREQVQGYERAAEIVGKLEATGGTEALDLTPTAQMFVTGIQNAAAAGNSGLLGYIGNILGGANSLRSSFITAGGLSSEAYLALADAVRAQHADFAKTLEDLAANAKPGGGKPTTTKPAPAKVSIGGGNTFQIKQDFRDQDPDRVATVFQRDIVRAAVNRAGSGRGNFFGF